MENLDLSEEEGATSLSNAVPFSGLEGATSQSELFGSVFAPGHWSVHTPSARFHTCSCINPCMGTAPPFPLPFFFVESILLGKMPNIFKETDLKIMDGWTM